MFAPNVLNDLATRHAAAFKSLHEIEVALNQRFYQMSDAVSALVLAVASGEPLLLIGDPGTAKSRLIRVFCGMVGVLDLENLSDRREDYFEYLLTPFTEPGELFGYYDITKAQQGQGLHRDTRMMMQKARVVYLDEIFNASSAILNTLLAFMNERYFHDRGDRIKVALECLFAATNVISDAPELLAIYDRFLLRCKVRYAEPKAESIERLLSAGWVETYGRPHANFAVKRDLLQQLQKLRMDIHQYTARGELKPDQHSSFYADLAPRIVLARDYKLSEVSNRRLVKMIHVMLIHRLYRAVVDGEIGPKANLALGVQQLDLFRRFFLDHADDPQADLLEGVRIAQPSF
jgi:MoxR-like ATPase